MAVRPSSETRMCALEHRRHVVSRLVARGLTPPTLRLLLPDWDSLIDQALREHQRTLTGDE